jgi:puromycin-sensitive aminopeptidase
VSPSDRVPSPTSPVSAAAGSATPGSPGSVADNPFRLPRTLIPSRYHLTLSPNLGERTFVGDERVEATLHEPSRVLVCNAKELDVSEAWVVAAGTRIDATVALDEETERATLTLATVAPAGRVDVHFRFTGVLNDKLAGFYASTYAAEDGSTKVIATTQFEATDARRAFPCWDEPDMKAVFSVTLVVDDGLMAISNSPIAAETAMANRRRSVQFEDTPIMSTYLLCFVVGELEATAPVDADGVPVRVIHRPGQAHLTAFGLEVGVFALKHFNRYYNIAYPAKKYDLIALPDFAAGAMENLGAVTFREQLLLVDADQAAQADLERIADVVSHETAHMWFGDLVTMKWWNGLWLNEAFATFMEVHCVDAFRPDWDRWTAFAIARGAAMSVDGLHSTRPIEYPVISPKDADGMFDVLTYEKGGSVLRMLEQYLGADTFRDGVRHYLQTHAFANTETTDLFDSLEIVSGEPVRSIMDGWIFRGGYPLISATTNANTEISLKQHRFTYLEGAESRAWNVPVIVRTGDSTERIMLNEDGANLAVGTGPVVVNAGGHGFYRVAYDDALLGRLLPHLSHLPAVERYGIVADTWAAVVSGALGAGSFLNLVANLGSERDPNVWAIIAAGFGALDQIANDDARPGLRQRLVDLAEPVAVELGWQGSPGESPLLGQTRATVLIALGTTAAHEPTRARALSDELLNPALAGAAVIDPNVAVAVITIAAANGDAAIYERFLAAKRSAPTPQLEQRVQFALATFPHTELATRTAEFCLTDEIRSQDAAYVLNRMLTSRANGVVAWKFVAEHWDALVERVPDNSVVRMCEGFVWRTEPEVATAIPAFFAEGSGHEIPQGAKQLSQHLERQRVSVALRNRERNGLAAAVAAT